MTLAISVGIVVAGRGARMQALGLLGGMSWESSAIYYRLLNQGVRARRGGLHAAPLLLWSPDFAPIAALQENGDWAVLGEELSAAACRLVRAGAGALLICTNTMHKVYAQVQDAAGVEVLHIVDATGEALRRRACRRPALLATRFTMEGAFFTERLRAVYSIDAMIPDAAARMLVNRIIYQELCRGIVRDDSRRAFQDVIEAMRREGADSVILGCTEITMLIGAEDSALPVFDTTALHAEAGVAWIIAASSSEKA